MPKEHSSRVTEISAKRIYTLKIAIKHIRPSIWRRVRVPGSLTMADLHGVIQAAFGWTNSHMHNFEVAGKFYRDPRMMDLDDLDETRFSLDSVFGARLKKGLYTYDFGDDWEHQVTVEKREPPTAADMTPVCLAGKRAGPPEDCGGPWGYSRMVEVAKNPNSKAYKEMCEWSDIEMIEPEAFDVEETNVAIAGYRRYVDLDVW